VNAKGLVWLGTRTRNFDDTVRFFGDALGLRVAHQEPDFTVLKLPNGDTVEVFGPGDTEHEHFDTGPVAGFLVDDVAEARTDLEADGVELIGPAHVAADGGSWVHFRGPDGNVYEITTPAPGRPGA